MSPSAIDNTLEGKRPPLLQDFKGVVATPSDRHNYKIKRWADNAVRQAACVVFPVNTEDISLAIRFARAEGLSLAISGGRHNCSGSSSSEGGLVIDMRKMSVVRVDTERKVGYIQGGTTTHHAVIELFKHGVAIPVGFCGSVGVIGLAAGGGVGFSTGLHGLACDNIVSATMVLANGDIVHVNESEKEDLLWGIKGGGSNFGVIAELGMRLHEPRADVYHLMHIYLPDRLPALVAELNAWMKVRTPEESLLFNFVLSPQNGKVLAYLGLKRASAFGVALKDSVRHFLPRFGLVLYSNISGFLWFLLTSDNFLVTGPIINKSAQTPYDKIATFADAACERLGTKINIGAPFNNFDYETVQRSYDLWLRATVIAPHSVILYEFLDYTQMFKVPMDATACPWRTMDKIAMIGIMGFTDEAEAMKLSEELRTCISSSSTESTRESIGYPNYSHALGADNETDANARKAFGSNYTQLQQLKRKYDPEMVFNKWYCVRPADV
ncbi:hypothetical protein FRB96_003661 [Tulasnella sp. 330]|nr:hypothetical protein FRB96_003661 [Tulasnella sp. 330]